MIRVGKVLCVALFYSFALVTEGCGGTQGGAGQQNPTTPSVSVALTSSSITTAQSLHVAVTVAGSSGTPTGSVVLSSGTYKSASASLSAGAVKITITAGSLAVGSDTLTASYAPGASSSSKYLSASGTAPVTVTTAAVTPKVTVSPASGTITTAQSLAVTVGVSSSSGTPTGSVVLACRSYASSSATLSSGSAVITIPGGSLAAGTDSLTAKYTPDSASSSAYGTASGTASVTVTRSTSATVTVTPDATSLPFAQNLIVSVGVAGSSGTPTGAVVLSGAGYTSPSTTVNNGMTTFYVAPGSLAAGSDTLTATYTPDASSSSTYSTSTGTAPIAVTSPGSSRLTVTIDTLANRHQISPYVYGINTTNSDNISGMSPGLVRFGGNPTSNYNWKLFTYNAGGDWYFEDFGLGNTGGLINDSVKLVNYTVGAGSHMLTTMPMLNWVAKESENGSNHNWSFSVATFGAQCSHDPYNSDAGNGLKPDCSTPITSSVATNAYYPLVDTAGDCTTGDCLARDAYAQSLSAAFGTATCEVPYSDISSCHFYDLDNEPEIWDGSHRDVHPVHPGYTELSSLFETDAANLKEWDPSAVRFGPVTCCWNYWWTAGPGGDDKNAHGGIDYLPWWLNQIYWQDQINGARTLDVFDLHAYVGPNVSTSGFTDTQLRAAAAGVYRTWWDPTYYNQSYDADWITMTQPNRGVTFAIPRMKALVNAVYPGTPLSFSEWESFLVPQSEWDFATALSDADAFGIMGREGLSFSTRWGGPDATDGTTNQPHPNYQTLQLYTAHGFGSLSVSDQTNTNPDLVNGFAALDSTGTKLTIMVLNKDPNNAANVTFNLNGFNAATCTAYTLASTNPGAITTSASAAWSATQSFAPYTVTLLIVDGAETSQPASEWYLNPDDLMIAASGKGILNPKITAGAASVTLSSAVFDAFEGAPACSGSLALTNSTITASTPATITVNTGSTPGFCHYAVTGNDGTSTQTQGGWIVVGKPAGALSITAGDKQSGSAGAPLTQSLTVTVDPGQSGLSKSGASILFTTSAGTLSNGTTSGSSVIATTNSSGVASVTLTLSSSRGPVTVTAQDQFAFGGTSVTFTEASN
ncbi:MAG TPA: glycoside hydrolase family 44 protein [Terracidiphilus sp.]|jgi:hypothetical protein